MLLNYLHFSYTKHVLNFWTVGNAYRCHTMWVWTGPPRAVGNVSATDASLTADPGVASSIRAWSHTFVEIDHEMISTAILLPSAESSKKGVCQLQAKVCARSTG